MNTHSFTQKDKRPMITTIPAGSAEFKIIYNNDGTPVDYKIISINTAFKEMTQLKSAETTKKTLMEILPASKKYWLEMFAEISGNGEPVIFEHYSSDIDKHLQVSIFFSGPGLLFCSLIDISGRKLYEDTLKKNNQFLQNISDNMSDLVSLTDMEGNYKFLGASHSVLGYDLGAMVGKNVLEFVHPDDLSEVSSAFRDFTANLENNRKIEYRYKCADGSYLWFETVGRFTRDDSGNPIEILFCTRDISRRKKTEAKLLEVQAISHIGRWELDLVSSRLEWSEGIFDLFEISRKDFSATYESFLSYVHPDDRIMLDKAYQKSLNEKTPYTLEHRLLMPDNRIKWVSEIGRTDYDSSDRPVRSIGTVQDITERKISEEYRDMNRKILELLNESEDLHIIMQKVLDFIKAYTGFEAAGLRLQAGNDFPYFVHDGFTEDFLQTENSLLERDTFGDVCREEDGSLCLECTCGQVISGRTSPANQYFTRGGSCWTDGKADIPFKDTRLNPRDRCMHDGFQSVALIPVRDRKRIFGLVHLMSRNKGLLTLKLVEKLEEIVWNIGSALMRRQAEEEQEKLQEQLNQSQKMESVGRLAGGVAHDFNNMLGAIIGHTELAIDSIDPAHPAFADLVEIEKAALRSADLTKQLLGFARKQTAAPKVLDLNEEIDGMFNMLKRLIGENIKLLWLPGTKLWNIKMDSSQIDQILTNLCVNASDAINGIGSLNISTETCVVDNSITRNRDGFYPGEYVKLSITDDGCGMDKETKEKLFEPYFTTKTIGKGTGLGLATVYGIVKQNRGFIDVYSEPGQGSSFSIYLPRYYGTDYMNKETMKEDVKTGNETILLVEDDSAILKMTAIILGRLGYSVKTASTPDEAKKMSELFEDKIHLLITDVIMPEMNGHDLAAELLLIYPNLKILFMSGYTDDIISRKGLIGPGVNYIQKPFSMKSLGEKVRSILDKSDSLIGI